MSFGTRHGFYFWMGKQFLKKQKKGRRGHRHRGVEGFGVQVSVWIIYYIVTEVISCQKRDVVGRRKKF